MPLARTCVDAARGGQVELRLLILSTEVANLTIEPHCVACARPGVAILLCLAFLLHPWGRAAAAQEVDCDPITCPSPEKEVAQALDKLKEAARCGQPDARVVICNAADGWATGTAKPLPVGRVLAGIKVLLVKGQPDDLCDNRKLDLQLLAVRSVRGKVTLARVWRPFDEWADDAVPGVLGAIAGQGTTARALAHSHVDLALALELASHPPIRHEHSWQWEDCEQEVHYQLRKVGPNWVALGTAGAELFSFTVFAQH